MVFALLAFALAVSPLWAQIHYFPPSVTSLGPQGQLAPAPFPSVTSLGPLGFYGNPFLPPNQQFIPFHRRPFGHRLQASPFVEIPVPIYTPVPVYPLIYPMGYAAVPGDGALENTESQGQLVFPSARTTKRANPPAYAPQSTASESAASPSAQPATSSASAAAPAPEQEATVLVFRDGHRLTVRNYAIVGPDLYNFSGEGPRKIALASLDLNTTIRVNDDRGVTFEVPGKVRN